MDGLVELAVWVVILLIAGAVTLVQKIFEKAKAKQRGEKVDVAAAVREQLDRYIAVREGRPPPVAKPAPPAEAPPAPPRPAPPRAAPALLFPVDSGPAVVDRDVARSAAAAAAASAAPRPILRPTSSRPVEARKPSQLAVESAALETAGRRARRAVAALTPKTVREGVLLAEILGPPMAERTDYRLF